MIKIRDKSKTKEKKQPDEFRDVDMTINRAERGPELRRELPRNKVEMKPPPKMLGMNEKPKMQEKLENDSNKDKVEKKGEVPKSERKERNQPDFTIEI